MLRKSVYFSYVGSTQIWCTDLIYCLSSGYCKQLSARYRDLAVGAAATLVEHFDFWQVSHFQQHIKSLNPVQFPPPPPQPPPSPPFSPPNTPTAPFAPLVPHLLFLFDIFSFFFMVFFCFLSFCILVWHCECE